MRAHRPLDTLRGAAALALLAALAAACGDPASDGDSDGDDPTATNGTTGDASTTGTADATGDTSGDTTGGHACGLAEVPCVPQAIEELGLLADTVSDASVSNSADGDGWRSVLDASAGGAMAAAMNPWVYLRFTDAGLARVDLDDVAATESDAWDVAAKRYGIRVNSGTSGPSCVLVATAEGDYAAIAAAPDDAEFAAERYYDDSCALIEDSSGIAGNPAYRMSGWWGYAGCVTTTGQSYVVRLADGRDVKLVIDAYYAEGQEACNESGSMGTGSATMTWRWSYLP
ncbi:MAG: HmuY family protein [Nannocystaceae bacterium]